MLSAARDKQLLRKSRVSLSKRTTPLKYYFSPTDATEKPILIKSQRFCNALQMKT